MAIFISFIYFCASLHSLGKFILAFGESMDMFSLAIHARCIVRRLHPYILCNACTSIHETRDPIEIPIFCIGLSVTIFGWIADIFDCIEIIKLSTHMNKYIFGRPKISLFALCVLDATALSGASKDMCVCVCVSTLSICQKIYVDFNGRNQRHRKKLWTLEI